MNKSNILIVDDESESIKMILNILEEVESYELLVATSGEQALKAVKTHAFDLILLDIKMEPMDGYDVCEILKKDAKTEHIPIIFLTTQNDKESIDKIKIAAEI